MVMLKGSFRVQFEPAELESVFCFFGMSTGSRVGVGFCLILFFLQYASIISVALIKSFLLG